VVASTFGNGANRTARVCQSGPFTMHIIDRVATPTGTDAHAFDELPPAGIRELPLKYKIGAPLQGLFGSIPIHMD
jgi:hypothetical protein